MSAPLFLVPAGGLAGLAAGGTFVLDGDEGRHAATVRRLRAGEPVDVADGEGALARCTVGRAGRDSLELRIDDLESVPSPVPALVLVQALAKGGRDEQAVEAATEVGVDAIVPWQSARSVVRWSGERGERSRAKWVSTARAAAKQSRRARVPAVRAAVDTAGLAGLVPAAAGVLVLHEEAERPLGAVSLPAAGELLVVVGPEGGIAPEELSVLVGVGAAAVRLGPQVLRASTAGPVALAVLASRLGRWQ